MRRSPTTSTAALPRRAGDMLGALFYSPDIRNKLKRYGSLLDWKEVVGEEFARVSQPERLSRGRVLVVRVFDPTWLQELVLARDSILARLNERESFIEDVRFVSGDPTSFPRLRKPR